MVTKQLILLFIYLGLLSCTGMPSKEDQPVTYVSVQTRPDPGERLTKPLPRFQWSESQDGEACLSHEDFIKAMDRLKSGKACQEFITTPEVR